MSTDLSEAEVQVLATLGMAGVEDLAKDRTSMEASGERFWIFLEDWSDAYAGLVKKGLIEGGDEEYRLTQRGRPLAAAYHEQRPDHYWYYYQRFYPAALASRTHSELCRRVFGKDLTQEGQMDMSALEELLDRLDLGVGDRVLDLGCGAGAISEYISDVTGAIVRGVDYAASAVAAAVARTEDKRARLMFEEGDLNSLGLEPGLYDAAILIDSIYWAADIPDTLESIFDSLKQGGQIAVAIAQTLEDGEGADSLDATNTEIGRAFERLQVTYDVIDQTEAFRNHWPRMKAAIVDLRADFEAEGNGFIADAIEREADDEYLPATRDEEVRRYLYLADKQPDSPISRT